MAIRRFRDHVAEHDWFAVTVDIGVVVIGVFLGMQVSNWNSDRLDRTKGHEYRVRLAEELKTTETAMASFRTYVDDAKAYGVDALDVFDHPEKPAGIPFLLGAYEASQVVPRGGRHATYDEIMGAGDLALIGPPDLRDRVSNYFWRMDSLFSLDAGSTPYRESLRTVMPNAVQEVIRAQCDEIPSDLGNGLIAPQLPKECNPDIQPDVAAAAAAQLRATPGLRDALNRQLSTFDARSITYDKLGANARALREAIERYDQSGRLP